MLLAPEGRSNAGHLAGFVAGTPAGVIALQIEVVRRMEVLRWRLSGLFGLGSASLIAGRAPLKAPSRRVLVQLPVERSMLAPGAP